MLPPNREEYLDKAHYGAGNGPEVDEKRFRHVLTDFTKPLTSLRCVRLKGPLEVNAPDFISVPLHIADSCSVWHLCFGWAGKTVGAKSNFLSSVRPNPPWIPKHEHHSAPIVIASFYVAPLS